MVNLRKIKKDKLEEILRKHQLWLDTKGKEGERANFRKTNLSQVDLRETTLSKADFTQAILHEADLSHANLSRANFFEADLTQVTLSHADLKTSNFSYANLRHATLSEANLKNAKLLGADLTASDLSGSNLRQTDLNGAEFIETDFTEADLQGANLNQADLYNATLIGANLTGASLRNTELIRVNLCGVDLSGADLYGANLNEANLSEAILEKSNLSGANLSNVNLRHAKLNGANLILANLNEACLTNADLEESKLQSVLILDKVGWDHANFKGAIMDQHTYNQIPNKWIAPYKRTIVIDNTIQINEPNVIVRSIEFPPEYKQSGISILNYFGEILSQKYPDMEVGVTIKQNGLKVSMIIHTPEGQREAVEKTLEQYGLIIQKKMLPSQFLSDELQIMRLEYQLSHAQVQLEAERRLLQFAEERLDSLQEDMRWLKELVGTSLQQHQPALLKDTKKRLTPREYEAVLLLQEDGATNVSIAHVMGITEGAVETLLRLARRKIGVQTRDNLKQADISVIAPLEGPFKG